jgi:PKHD-type hydroxylase
MMLHIPNVLDPEQAVVMRNQLLTADWIDGRASVGSQGAAVKRNRQLPEDHPLARQMGDTVARALTANTLFFSAALPLRILPPFFNRYEGGETYGLHVDGAVRTLPAGDGYLRADLSATLFLSDPESYDGGELVVVDTYGTHEVKLPAGDLILYPASSLHSVQPVTRGVRLASFLWLQSMVRDDHQRNLLFELDQTIQRLRAQHGESPEALSLTNHYHNLLRLWVTI